MQFLLTQPLKCGFDSRWTLDCPSSIGKTNNAAVAVDGRETSDSELDNAE